MVTISSRLKKEYVSVSDILSLGNECVSMKRVWFCECLEERVVYVPSGSEG